MSRRKIRKGLLQLLKSKTKYLTAPRIGKLGNICLIIGNKWNIAKKVNQIIIIHCPHRSYLCRIRVPLRIVEQPFVFLQVGQCLITMHYHFKKIIPKIVKLLVISTPPMLIKMFPKASVVPIPPSHRQYCLVGGKGIVIINTSIGTL